MKAVLSLLKGSVVMFFGMAVASAANWFFTVVMGRTLGPTHYAELVSLVALLGILAVPSQATQVTAAKFVSQFAAKNELAAITHLWRRFYRWFLLFSVVGFALYLAASPTIANFLRINNLISVVLLGTTILTMFVLAVNRGILQGLEDFGKLSANIATDPGLKLLLGMAAVALGLGVAGAIGGISLGILVALVVSHYWIKGKLPAQAKPVLLGAAKRYSWWTLGALVLLALLFNNDVILVKHFFDPTQAGFYGALSTVGKIVFFVTAPIAAVMFPLISKQIARNEKHYQLLLGGLGLVGLAGSLILVVYQITPGLVVRLVYGNAYNTIVPYLGIIGLVFLLYSLIFTMVQYFMSVGNKLMIVPLGITTVLHYLALTYYHGSFGDVAMGQMIALAIGLVMLFTLYAIPKITKLIKSNV
ncbi:oligosaccharide flippase family protein [Candidatus Berkelbacteria bacterium]|nr:oligosaccharide flippase family protein [Candidatus Berkelbacteria bacterium]